MKTLLLLLSLLLSFSVEAKQVNIAIVDTGMPDFSTQAHVCGFRDFTGTGMKDNIGHGTNIMGIISDRLKGIDYCLYIMKVYNTQNDYNFLNSINTFKYLTTLSSIDIVNYSFTGPSYIKIENDVINELLKKNIKFVTAAGNDNKNLDILCNTYPACYKGVISVGNLNEQGHKYISSNYGKVVTAWRCGNHVCANNICMSGTSQAAAVYTSDLAKEIYNNGKK